MARRASGRGLWLLTTGLLVLTPALSIAASASAEAHPVGSVLYAARATTVRTRGSGNLSVDLPRGRAVIVVDLGPDSAVLAPAPPDAEMLRAHGVRRTPRYTASRAQIQSDFLTPEAWSVARREGMLRVRERFPALSEDQAERVFLGEPWIGMTEEQAEEAVGALVLARGPVAGRGSATAWTVGRRPRSAELRVFTEARERGARARSFDEYLKGRVRATLIFEDDLLVSIEPPDGGTPGLNWP